MTVVFVIGFLLYQTFHYALIMLTRLLKYESDQKTLSLTILVCSYIGAAFLFAVDVYMLIIGLNVIALMAPHGILNKRKG